MNGDARVLRKTTDTRQIDANIATPRCQIGIDLIDGLAIEPNSSHGLVSGTREANQ